MNEYFCVSCGAGFAFCDGRTLEEAEGGTFDCCECGCTMIAIDGEIRTMSDYMKEQTGSGEYGYISL